MRVLFSTTAGSGHFGPLVPFARACEAAGHDVRVAAPASFGPAVARAGFAFAPFADPPPEELAAAFARLGAPGAGPAPTELQLEVVVGEVFGRIDACAALPGLDELVASWSPDVIVHEPGELASYVVAERHGVPHVLVSIGLAATDELTLPVLAAPVNALRATVGLAPDPRLDTLRWAPRWTCWPASLEDPAAPRPAHHRRFRDRTLDPDPGSPPLPGGWWKGDDDPFVYVSFGSVAATMPGVAEVYPAAVDALAGLPVRVLLTLGDGGDPDQLRPLPANVHVERWWPQADVMPHAAALVGHGGFGTTLLGLASGTPMVVMPLFSADQHLNAERVAAAGAGLVLDGGPAALARLRDAITAVLDDPSYAEAAGAVAEEIADLPDVAEAVAVLEASV